MINNGNGDNFKEIRKYIAANVDEAIVDSLMRLVRDHQPSSITGRDRWQDEIIIKQLPKGCSVLDLGCGDGALLNRLIKDLGIRGQGVELDPQAVLNSIDLGVPVLNVDLDEGLSDFADKSFDYVILEGTLQTLHRPMLILKEMLRVGHKGIVSFPNFGHWRVRLDLFSRGRMPVTNGLPFGWHDTPNIHLFTIADFLDWCQSNQVKVAQSFVLCENNITPLNDSSNLNAEEALLFLETAE